MLFSSSFHSLSFSSLTTPLVESWEQRFRFSESMCFKTNSIFGQSKFLIVERKIQEITFHSSWVKFMSYFWNSIVYISYFLKYRICLYFLLWLFFPLLFSMIHYPHHLLSILSHLFFQSNRSWWIFSLTDIQLLLSAHMKLFSY